MQLDILCRITKQSRGMKLSSRTLLPQRNYKTKPDMNCQKNFFLNRHFMTHVTFGQ